MTERSRTFLRNQFADGERPSGEDFSDLIESCVNKSDDKISIDDNGTIDIQGGLNLGDTPNGKPGTLRFNGGRVEVFDGGEFNPLGGSGAFAPFGATQDITYGAGNVGIGNFVAPPTHKFEVGLSANTAPDERVQLGQLAVHNGQDNDAAYICHESVAENDNSFALRQDSQGNTTVNSAVGTQILLTQGLETRMQITAAGDMIFSPRVPTGISLPVKCRIKGDTEIGEFNFIGGSPIDNKNLSVSGQAFKRGGGGFAAIISDARAKRNVRPLDHGLEAICKLEPVYYRYNKASGMGADKKEYVGLTAQNVQEHLPSLIIESEIKGNDTDAPMLTYDPGPLEYIMINAIKELTKRVETLEATIEELQKK